MSPNTMRNLTEHGATEKLESRRDEFRRDENARSGSPADQPSRCRDLHRWRLSFVLFVLGFLFLLLCAGAANGKKAPPAAPLDLNAATAAQLVQVPGIGAATAKAIVQFREKSGPFQRVEDLLAIRGISARKLAQIRPYVIVAKPPPRRPSSWRGSTVSSA